MDISTLFQEVTIDLEGLTPELKNFIYAEVAADKFPLGEIIKRAANSPTDAQALDIQFQEIKRHIPAIVAALPLEKRMLIQPIMNYFLKK